ncbi:hypothetical protein ACPOLB_24885 [Rubrivivax sp. RP6-9]|uniref:hypothetical protein n=1 Tax=Rubrivivax sp. RP6-9 TaxID=3415750 RepID=UPI003CC5E55A
MSQPLQSDARARGHVRAQGMAGTAVRGSEGRGAGLADPAGSRSPVQRMTGGATARPGPPGATEGGPPARPGARSQDAQAALQIAMHQLLAAANTPVELPPVGDTGMNSVNPWGNAFGVQDDDEASEEEGDKR